MQQQNEDLKKEHETEVVLLKRKVMELKEELHAKTATDETNDNLIFVHDTVINPSNFEQEITIKEEQIE